MKPASRISGRSSVRLRVIEDCGRIDGQTSSCYGSSVIQQIAYHQCCRRTCRIQECETCEKLRVRCVSRKGKVRIWRRSGRSDDKSTCHRPNGRGCHSGTCG